MGGGLLQLVAYGAQDAYITGNPHITFWKVLYKRHTNFAMEAMRVNFTGTPSYGQRSVVVINRNADLMFRTYLEVTLPDTRLSALGTQAQAILPSVTASSSPTWDNAGIVWTPGGRRRLGYLLIQQVEIEIGGQVMDRHYGEWMFLWESLTSNFDQSTRLDQMMGQSSTLRVSSLTSCGGRPTVLYIPLSFWFCRNPGLALPLIALQYHEVRLNFIFRQATDLVCAQYDPLSAGNAWPGGIPQAAQLLPRFKDAAVYVDYIYLDTDERRRFAQQSHEYLIDQLQYGLQQSVTSQTVRLDLTLNHPVKELVWVFQDARKLDCSLPSGRPTDTYNQGNTTSYTQPFSYDDIANRCRLQLNGQDRFDERYGDYFWKVQPYQHHSGGGFEMVRGSLNVQATIAGNLTGTVTTPGSFYVVFQCTSSAGAVGSGTFLTTGGAVSQAQYTTAGNPVLTILSATLTATGLPMGILAGGANTITAFTGTTPGSISATLSTTPSTGSYGGSYGAGTIVAYYDAAPLLNDPLSSQALTGTLTGAAASVGSGATGAPITNPINVYSFSLAPEEHQPSGSCNFSRIDTTTLVFDSIVPAGGDVGLYPSKKYPYLFRMYAVNYNIFRVMSGMGGLAYSN